MNFNFKQRPNRPMNTENCKIKIKNTAHGKELSFSGNCSKEQLQMAKSGFLDDNIQVEEE